MAITGGTFSRDNQVLEVSFPQNTGSTSVEHDVHVSGKTETGNEVLSNKAVVKQTPECKIEFSQNSLTVPGSGACYNTSVRVDTTGITVESLSVADYTSGTITLPFITTTNGLQYLDFCVSANASASERSGSVRVTGIDVYGEERTAELPIVQSAGSVVGITLSAVGSTGITATETSANLRFTVSGGKLTRGFYDNGNPFTDVIDKTNNYSFVLEETPSDGDVTGGTITISFIQNRSYTYTKEYTVCLSGLSIFNETVDGSSVNVVSNDVTFVQNPRSKSGSIKLIADNGTVLYSETSETFTIISNDVQNVGWCQSQSSGVTNGSISGNRLTITFPANTSGENAKNIVAVVSGITSNDAVVYCYGEVVQGKAPTLKLYDQGETPSTGFTSAIESKSYETSRRFFFLSDGVSSIDIDRSRSSSNVTGSSVYQSSSSIVVNIAVNENTGSTVDTTVTVTGITANSSTISATYKFTQGKKDIHTFKLHKNGDESEFSASVTDSVTTYPLSVTSSGVTNIGVVETTATAGFRVTSPLVGEEVSSDFSFNFDRNTTQSDNIYTIRLSGKTEDTGERIESNTFTVTQAFNSQAPTSPGEISFTNPSVSVDGDATSSTGNTYVSVNCVGSSVAVTSIAYGDGQPIQTGASARVDQTNKTVTLEFPANTSPTMGNTYTVGLTATDAMGGFVISSNNLVVTQGVANAPTITAYFTDSSYENPSGASIDIACSATSLYFIVEASNIDFSTAFPTVTSESIDFVYSNWEVQDGVGKVKVSSTFQTNDTTNDIDYSISCSVVCPDMTTITASTITAHHKTCRAGSRLYVYLKEVDGVEVFSETDIRKMILGVTPQTDYNNYKIPFTATTVTWLMKPEEIVYESAQIRVPSESIGGAEVFVLSALDENKNSQTGSKDVWNGSSFDSTGHTFTTSTSLSRHTMLWKKSRTKYVNGDEVAVTDDTDNGLAYITTNYGTGSIQNTQKSSGSALVTYDMVEGTTTVNRVQYSPAIVDASPEGGKVVFEYDQLGGSFSSVDVVFADGTVRPAGIELPISTNTLVFTYEGNFGEGEKFTEFYVKSGGITSNPIKVRQKKLEINPALKVSLDTGTTSMDDTGEMIAKPATNAIWTVEHTGITVSTIGLVYPDSANIVSVNGTNPTETGQFSMASFLNGSNPVSTPRLVKITISGSTVIGTQITATAQAYQSGVAKDYGLKVFAPSNITFKEQTVYLSVGTSYVSLNSLNIIGISGNTSPIINSLERFSADSTSQQSGAGYCIYRVTVPENTSEEDGDQVIFKTVATGTDAYGNSHSDYAISVQGLYVPEAYIKWLSTGYTIYATATTVTAQYEERDVTGRTVSSSNSSFVGGTPSGGNVVVTTTVNNTGSNRTTVLTLYATGTTGVEIQSEGCMVTQLCKPELSFVESSPVVLEYNETSKTINYNYDCIYASQISVSSSGSDANHFTVTKGTAGKINITCPENTGTTRPEVTVTIKGTNNTVESSASIVVRHNKQEPMLEWVFPALASINPTVTSTTISYQERDISSGTIGVVSSDSNFTGGTPASGNVTITTQVNDGQVDKTTDLKLTATTNDGNSIQSGLFRLTQLCSPLVTPIPSEVTIEYDSTTAPNVTLQLGCVDLTAVTASVTSQSVSGHFSAAIEAGGGSNATLKITCSGQNTGTADITGTTTISYSNHGVSKTTTVTMKHKKLGTSLAWTSSCPVSMPSSGGSVTLTYSATNVTGITVTSADSDFTPGTPSNGSVTITGARNDTGGSRSVAMTLAGTSTESESVSGGDCYINQSCYPAIGFTTGAQTIGWSSTGTTTFNFTGSCVSTVVGCSSSNAAFTATLDGNSVKVAPTGQNTDTSSRSSTITVTGKTDDITVTATTTITQNGFDGQGSISLAASTYTVGTGATSVYCTATTTYVAWSGATVDLAGATITDVNDQSGGVTTASGYVSFTVNIPAYSAGGGTATDSFTDCDNFTLTLAKDGYFTSQWTHSGGSGSDEVCLTKSSRTITVTAYGLDSNSQTKSDSVTITQS